MVLTQRVSQQILEEVIKHINPNNKDANQMEFDFVEELDRNTVVDDYTEDKVAGLIFFQDAITDTGN